MAPYIRRCVLLGARRSVSLPKRSKSHPRWPMKFGKNQNLQWSKKCLGKKGLKKNTGEEKRFCFICLQHVFFFFRLPLVWKLVVNLLWNNRLLYIIMAATGGHALQQLFEASRAALIAHLNAFCTDDGLALYENCSRKRWERTVFQWYPQMI